VIEVARRKQTYGAEISENLLLSMLREIKNSIRIIDERIDFIESDLMRIRTELRRLRESIEETRRGRIERRSIRIMRRDVEELFRVPLTPTESEVLSLIISNPRYGEAGATEIAEMIGKSREHVARALKKLVEKGLLDRDTSSFPYKYFISEELKRIVLERQTI